MGIMLHPLEGQIFWDRYSGTDLVDDGNGLFRSICPLKDIVCVHMHLRVCTLLTPLDTEFNICQTRQSRC